MLGTQVDMLTDCALMTDSDVDVVLIRVKGWKRLSIRT